MAKPQSAVVKTKAELLAEFMQANGMTVSDILEGAVDKFGREAVKAELPKAPPVKSNSEKFAEFMDDTEFAERVDFLHQFARQFIQSRMELVERVNAKYGIKIRYNLNDFTLELTHAKQGSDIGRKGGATTRALEDGTYVLNAGIRDDVTDRKLVVTTVDGKAFYTMGDQSGNAAQDVVAKHCATYGGSATSKLPIGPSFTAA